MFERFTERSRETVVHAQEEARALKHNYIGTEHGLLGLLRGEDTIAARVLASLNVTIEEVRRRVLEAIGQGEESVSGQIPFTPRMKKVYEISLREALSLGHNYIGTEHILLALVREGEGVGARILGDLGADEDAVRNRVIRALKGSDERATTTTTSAAPQTLCAYCNGTAHGVGMCPRVQAVEYHESGHIKRVEFK